jgi:hypothetical protein
MSSRLYETYITRGGQMGHIARVAVGIPLLGASLALGSAGGGQRSTIRGGNDLRQGKRTRVECGCQCRSLDQHRDRVKQGDCIVVNQVLRAASTFGRESTSAKVLLSLNCNAVVASAGDAGNSAASPAGQKAKKEQAALAWRATPDGQAWSVQAKQQHPDWFPIEGCP